MDGIKTEKATRHQDTDTRRKSEREREREDRKPPSTLMGAARHGPRREEHVGVLHKAEFGRRVFEPQAVLVAPWERMQLDGTTPRVAVVAA